jgi:hypothetical protein
VLDKRLDEIMGKINDNIINKNYLNFYVFLLNGRPKYNKSSCNIEKNKIDKKKVITQMKIMNLLKVIEKEIVSKIKKMKMK